MNIAWTSLFILVTFLAPGVVAVLRFHWRRELVLVDELGKLTLAFIATLVALVLHFFWIGICLVCPFFPNPNLDLFYGFANGAELVNGLSLNASVLDHLPYVMAYIFTILLAGWAVGNLAAIWVVKEAPIEDELDLYLFNGVMGLWTMVDVLVECGILYRGLFHSRGHDVCGESTLHLTLVSKRKPAAGENTAADFIPIQRSVLLSEIGSMVWDSLVAQFDGDLEKAEKKCYGIFGSPQSLDAFFDGEVEKAPQLVIPWRQIRNLNVRPYEIDGIDDN